MKSSISFFQLSLKEKYEELSLISRQTSKKKSDEVMSLEDYYRIEDTTNSLERLRQYQWRDFLGRYKIF